MSHRMKGHHKEVYGGNLKTSNYQLKHLQLTGGWIRKNKKGHQVGGVATYTSKSGKKLYVRYNRNGRIMEITSDEADENQDDDDQPGKDSNKFGKRTIKNTVNKIKKLLEDSKNKATKFKDIIKQSITMKDVKSHSLTDFIKNANPVDLWEKAVNVWENKTGKIMSDLGKGKMYDFAKSIVKAVDQKKAYKNKIVKLDEDTDVLSADDFLALVLF